MGATFFTYSEVEKGMLQCVLDLTKLYSSKKDRQDFEERWAEFYASDPYNAFVFEKNGDSLLYLSEEILPDKKSTKPSALLLFGNPAQHSVHERMYFSFEGNKREHRIWRIFRDVELLDFEKEDSGDLTYKKINQKRKKQLYSLEYASPFRLGFACFISCPSTPSKPPWSGVAGVYKLFGKKASSFIIEAEQKRLAKTVKSFLQKGDMIVAFQKDAYIYAADDDSPHYNFKQLMQEPLIGTCAYNKDVTLIGVPPTRFLQGKEAKEQLQRSVMMRVTK